MFYIGIYSQIIGSHLNVPGVTREGEVCLKLIPQVTPLNTGELKVLEGTHESDPMELLGGQVGLEKHTKKLLVENHQKIILNRLTSISLVPNNSF